MCLPMRKSPFLVAVVVTHNRQAQLQQTLDRLLASSADDLAAVVVVDNASTDGTAACLRACADARLRVETLPTNQGGAGGFAYEEAARICQCAVGTVKSRVSRARKSLLGILESGGYARDGRAAGDDMRSILADADRLSGTLRG